MANNLGLRSKYRFLKLFILGVILLSNGFQATAQSDSTVVLTGDSMKVIVPNPRPFHSPHKASILSAVLPGAGQIYNKQYLWAPVFWSALAVSGYYISYNTKQFKEFKQGYILATDTISGNELARFSGNSTQYIKDGIEFYRRYRDLSYAAFGLSYILNIVQAAVGAHLFYFDVSEDISLHVQPYRNFTTQPAYGLRLTLNF